MLEKNETTITLRKYGIGVFRFIVHHLPHQLQFQPLQSSNTFLKWVKEWNWYSWFSRKSLLAKEKNSFKNIYIDSNKRDIRPDSRSCFKGSLKREQKGSHCNGTVTESQWQNSQSQLARIAASPNFPIPSRKPLSCSIQLLTTQGSLDPAWEILPVQRTVRTRCRVWG